jgi:hypothetical protein
MAKQQGGKRVDATVTFSAAVTQDQFHKLNNHKTVETDPPPPPEGGEEENPTTARS